MMDLSADLESLMVSLLDIEAIKFGNFKLKSGIMSPVYFDLRVIVSYPSILEQVANVMWKLVDPTAFKIVCGVPYTALPIATVMSVKNNVPMVIRRKEAKDYGTRKMVEGKFDAGDRCLIIEDVVTTGSSVLETEEVLRKDGLVADEAIVLVDRCQGGRENLESKGVKMRSVFSLEQMLDVLIRLGRLQGDMQVRVLEFLRENRHVPVPTTTPAPRPSFSQRAALCGNEIARRLFALVLEKRSNLAVAADVTSSSELLRIAETVGPFICVLKTHADIVSDFTPEIGQALRQIADKHNFLLFEDRKFADIGNTVAHQALDGPGRILAWADLINAHCLPGPGVLQGLSEAVKRSGRSVGCLLIAQMSPTGALFSADYTASCVSMATQHSDLVPGFICQEGLKDASPGMLSFTPGVKLEAGGDGFGQQYNTPQAVITERGSDVVIVGRGIIQADDVSATARRYQEAAFSALMARAEERPV